jgi:hypothetical protein
MTMADAAHRPPVWDVWEVTRPDGTITTVRTPKASTAAIQEALVLYDDVLRRLADR